MALEVICSARLPHKVDGINFSANGSYVALKFQDGWAIFNAETGYQTSAAISLEARRCRVSNDGNSLVTITNDQLTMASVDGKVRVQSISHHLGPTRQDVCFSAGSRFLWFTTNNQKNEGVLNLMDSSSLLVVDEIPKPH